MALCDRGGQQGAASNGICELMYVLCKLEAFLPAIFIPREGLRKACVRQLCRMFRPPDLELKLRQCAKGVAHSIRATAAAFETAPSEPTPPSGPRTQPSLAARKRAHALPCMG
eukprot:357308-Chlamydomonas_euryale.AAC.7